MAFSMTNVLNSLVEASTRKPHAVKVADVETDYVHQPMRRPDFQDMMDAEPARPARDLSKSSEQLEHDTLTRIRDALYREQQA